MENKLTTWTDKQIKSIKKILGYKELTFKEKVQSMTAKEIIMTMVESLRNPIVEVNMNTYGTFKQFPKKECYGCAATNFVCHVSGIKPDQWIHNRIDRTEKLGLEDDEFNFLYYFESAINELRQGDLLYYHRYAKSCGIARINNKHNLELPYLKTNYTKEDLAVYVQLANTQ